MEGRDRKRYIGQEGVAALRVCIGICLSPPEPLPPGAESGVCFLSFWLYIPPGALLDTDRRNLSRQKRWPAILCTGGGDYVVCFAHNITTGTTGPTDGPGRHCNCVSPAGGLSVTLPIYLHLLSHRRARHCPQTTPEGFTHRRTNARVGWQGPPHEQHGGLQRPSRSIHSYPSHPAYPFLCARPRRWHAPTPPAARERASAPAWSKPKS